MASVFLRVSGLMAVCTIATACAGDQSYDGGIGRHELTDMTAQIWVAPNGCKHWIIDDRQEGYLSPKLNRDGTPDCG